MNSMLNAIRSKRNQSGSEVDENTMMNRSPDAQGGNGLQDLVASLDDTQKQELMKLLSNEMQGSNPVEIEKGAPTNKEKQIIDAKIEQQAMEDGEQSDEIAMSMIDKNSLQKAEAGVKPRGLGDRAKMMAAQKLKQKGMVK